MNTYWYSSKEPFEGADWGGFEVRGYKSCTITYYTPDREYSDTDLRIEFDSKEEMLNMIGYISTFIGLPYHRGMRHRIRKMYEVLHARTI